MTRQYNLAATSSNKTKLDEASEFYQIRIQPVLKAEFMRQCHEQALNPSAVVRMLMDGWNRSNNAPDPRSSTKLRNKSTTPCGTRPLTSKVKNAVPGPLKKSRHTRPQ